MSLINQNKAFNVGDYLFIAAGVLAAIWFFLTYSSQDPRSAMQTSLEKDSAILKAAEQLHSFGYSTGDLNAKASFEVARQLLDSLQQRLGRAESIRMLRDSISSPVYPFYWQVFFIRSEGLTNMEIKKSGGDRIIGIRLNDKGQWFELVNEQQTLPAQKLNRKALQYAFKEDSVRDFWRSIPDSVWNGILSFEVENGYDVSMQNKPETEKEESRAHVFSLYELKRLAEYYLDSSAWDTNNFELNEIQVKTLGNITGAELSYESKEPLLAQHVILKLTVIPTGALIGLDAEYNSSPQRAPFSEIWDLISIVAVFLFGLVAIVTFFLRMRARIVDTKSALVISVLAGLIIPIVIFLESVETIDLFGEGVQWYNLVGIALEMGILGALGSVGFFVVASIGDSITRQYWQEKLACYDYLRQGMFFNRPVGEALFRSIVLTFIMAGFWSLLLLLFPDLYFDLSETFLAYEAAWPPVFTLLNSAWFSLIMMLSIFLVAGALAYATSNSRWAFAASTVLAVAIIAPLPFSFGPGLQQFFVMAILGVGLTLIYLKWDILTLLVTHFLFVSMLEVSSGWLIPSSPDTYVFVSYILLLLFIISWAIFSILKGKEEQALPDYVPEYVEELAQEERIKQELQIAREVQQSFLPVQTPDMKGLDIAALCQPAYETGGDYYDFIQLDDHRVALTIGDVSGKGIQAAFYMTFTKGILHSLCHETDSPAELLKKTNRLFCDNAGKGTFISLVYGIIDLERRTFIFARAGHNPILYMNGQNGKVKELQPSGLGIGLTKEAPFDNNIKEVKLTLGDDDLLILYTDGIVEALNTSRQFYGEDRLAMLLTDKKDKTSKEILDLLSEDVKQFTGTAKQHDDMTIMVIKLSDKNGSNR